MKVLIFSDAHGSLELLDRVIEDIKPDLIYGLGDFDINEYELIERNILGVKGNSYFDPEYPIDRIFELNNFKIILTHGHTHNVRMGLLNISLFSKENKADIVFYGHTHVASLVEDKNIVFVNPGSITRPYSPSYSTIAIMNIESNSAYIKIVDSITYNVYKEIKINK